MYKQLSKIAVVTCLLWTTTIVIAEADGTSSSLTGTPDDPLITKSYFDQNIASRVKEELNKQTVTEDKVKQLIASEVALSLKGIQSTLGNNTSNTSTNPSTNGTAALTVIKLEQGQTLFGGAGTELIPRTGTYVAVSSDENGIPDVTAGKDIAAGSIIDNNHLFIIPREGRGIKIDAKSSDAYVMVRGSYLIVDGNDTK
jgi:hypothetical protein